MRWAHAPDPWLGDFTEINVRTYVTDALGRRGVWFFSLDVPRSPIVAVARAAFALPYCWAKTRHERDADRQRYTMRRRWPRSSEAEADLALVSAPASVRRGRRPGALSVRSLGSAHLSAPPTALRPGGPPALAPPPCRRSRHRPTGRRGRRVAQARGQPHAMYSPAVDVQVARFSKVSGPAV
ncbi:MAG: DUF2071 domain-containing protein [Candidatus Microthrix sp.]|uniref:DUF2071 domain-containing protein n=1 Tax=Candidatus Neomicrothrix subdominans TaxID=2954438 RepID=A0A936TEI6_9ACTN|nr:DUF2071 domain-containing protein [Candidatus Microthrix subdominans]